MLPNQNLDPNVTKKKFLKFFYGGKYVKEISSFFTLVQHFTPGKKKTLILSFNFPRKASLPHEMIVCKSHTLMTHQWH
jgi:hypothetical protein